MTAPEIRIGCAGWALPKKHAARFSTAGSHLVRYASQFNAVEINSSFYRSHRPSTYLKWAQSVQRDFRFAVKIPKEVTHTRRLMNPDDLLDRFFAEATALGENLGPLLVQLPPSMEVSTSVVEAFLRAVRDRFIGDVVLEPRHASWFDPRIDRMLAKFRVARVAADPAVVQKAAEPGGWEGLQYYRLHGSPRTYYSCYSPQYLDALAETLSRARARSATVWCIFDNTAAGEAIANALDILARVL